MQFYCLRQARLAKMDVLERILKRKISDGKWASDRKEGMAYIKSLRDEYHSGMSVEDILRSHPEVIIKYRENIKMHEVFIRKPSISS